MNTEKIEKLKKSLSNSKIPADLKPKIEAEIKRLESLDAIANEKAKEEKEEKEEAKEEVKPVAKARTPRAKKTSTAKSSETKKPKRTAMSLAKEIRKEGESWKEAQARASKMMKEGSKEVSKAVETELDKLSKLVKSKKELRSQVGKTNILIDSKRKAKPIGRRISKDGNVYYENRANRTDRGTYGKYHLAEGGYLTDPTFGTFQNQVFEGGGGVKPTLKKGDNVVVIGKRWFDRVNGNTYHTAMVLVNGQSLGKSSMTYGYDEAYLETAKEILLQHYNLPKGMTERSPLWQLREYGVTLTKTVSDGLKRDLAEGGGIGHYKVKENVFIDYMDAVNYCDKNNLSYDEIVKTNKYAKGGGVTFKNGREYSYGRNWTNDHKHVNKGEDHEVQYKRKRFELGGVMATDLAGHTGGGDAGFNAGMPLDGFSNTAYTGLVGETGAMSSGEMFMAGGSVDKNFDLSGYTRRIKFNDFEEAKEFVDMDRKKYPRIKEAVIIKEGNQFEVWVYPITGNRTGNRVYESGGTLPSGAEQSYMITESFGNPAQHYARGGGVGRGIVLDKFKGQSPNNRHYSLEMFTNPDGLDYFRLYDDTSNDILAQSYDLEEVKLYAEIFKGKRYADGGFMDGVYARGGGVRRVGNREYPTGRNWTNDHRHVNKGEDHEVKYNRKGKFLGVFNDGGGIENAKIKDWYIKNYPTDDLGEEINKNVTFEDLWNTLKEKKNIYKKIGVGDSLVRERLFEHLAEIKKVNYRDVYNKWLDADYYARGGGVRRVGNREYSYGRNWTNDHRHVNKGEDHEVNYTRKRKFMAGGMNTETPRIYVADLEAYNNGRLVGEWLDLSDYNDADELMDAIQDVLKKSGGEEYAIHDAENIPSSLYSEYMSRNDFQALYDVMETAKQNDLPFEVVQEIVSQYGEGAVDEFYGKYDSAEDFAYQLVDDMGIESFIDFERYLIISETDRRLLAQEMADSYVDDIRDEDGGNRLIEEAGMDVSEYEEADSKTQDEMLDKAREVVYDEYYDTWYDGLNDPYYFLVEEQGMYSADDFAKANFVQIDYEALAEALEYDYAFVYSDGDLYVFNIR